MSSYTQPWNTEATCFDERCLCRYTEAATQYFIDVSISKCYCERVRSSVAVVNVTAVSLKTALGGKCAQQQP
jgi:hypothetical protein